MKLILVVLAIWTGDSNKKIETLLFEEAVVGLAREQYEASQGGISDECMIYRAMRLRYVQHLSRQIAN